MMWIIALLALIAALLVALIAAVFFIGMAIEDRLNRMHSAIWDGLHAGNFGPYLADVVKQTRRP